MTPGPSEPTAEQLQKYLKLVVDDLIELFNVGLLTTQGKCPHLFTLLQSE